MSDDTIKERLKSIGLVVNPAPEESGHQPVPPAYIKPQPPSPTAYTQPPPPSPTSYTQPPVTAKAQQKTGTEGSLEDAELSYRGGRFDEALEKIGNLVPKIKESHQANFLRGKIYAAKNSMRAAIACFATAHASVATDFNYALEYAISLYNDNQKKEAHSVFRKCQKLQPTNQTVKNYISLLSRQFPDSKGGRPVETLPQQKYAPSPQPQYAPPQQKYAAPSQTPYAPPQQEYRPPASTLPFNAPPQQQYAPPPQPQYASSQQQYAPPPQPQYEPSQQLYAPPPQPQYEPSQQQYAPPPQQPYTPPPQPQYAAPPSQPQYAPPQQQYRAKAPTQPMYPPPGPPSGRESNFVPPPGPPISRGSANPVSGAGSQRSARPSTGGGSYSAPQKKKNSISEIFSAAPVESRSERAKRLREMDQMTTDEEIFDFDDPRFWDDYNRYNSTPPERISEAEASGDIHITSQDFAHLHRDEYEKELELKAQQAIFRPGTGWFITHVLWGAGSMYLGRVGEGFKRIIFQAFFIGLIVGSYYIATTPLYTNEIARQIHGQASFTKMIIADKLIFDDRRAIISQTGYLSLVFLVLIYGMIQSRYANAIRKEATERNLAFGLLTDVTHNLHLEINLGSLHGITSQSRIIVEKRSFVPVYDEKTGSQNMQSTFARIGRCQIKDIFETTTFCTYRPEEGHIVIPKVGDRVTVLPE